MEKTYITIVGSEHYQGSHVFRPGMRLKLVKDHKNRYDDEAIAAYSDMDVRYGYVANSIHTVARGTHSAGWLQHSFEEECTCIVRFIVDNVVIAEINGQTS